MGGTWAANMSVTSQQSSFPIRSTHNVHQVDAKLLDGGEEGAELESGEYDDAVAAVESRVGNNYESVDVA